MHKSGFVNIIGRPNVGKSTLMNALVGERMSIISYKPQTTRHRILGIISGDDYQIVFSDTPGMIRQPSYKMQEAMNRFVHSTFEDADLMIFVTEVGERYAEDDRLLKRLQQVKVPLFLVINKMDLADEEKINDLLNWWKDKVSFTEVIVLSALEKQNTDSLFQLILDSLPEGPEYYPKDQLSDRPERFFVSEIIREKILLNYGQEIPYSCEVEVESFKEIEKPDKKFIAIRAIIYVNRKTQKAIIIGKGGKAIKKLGIEARKSLEEFLGKQVYLEQYVKVREGWRDSDDVLRKFGY